MYFIISPFIVFWENLNRALDKDNYPVPPMEQILQMVVIYLNGTSTSECQHPSCWHTKGHLWIEGFPKHYRWDYYELHFSYTQLVIFYLLNMSSLVCDSSYMQLACCTRVSVIASRVHICTRVTLRETHESYTSCQY